MGNVNQSMADSAARNQEFMLETQRVALERQIHLQNEMREKLLASQIARSREMLYWFGAFYVVSAAGMLVGYSRARKPGTLVPLVPLSFLLGYQIDLCYGSKLARIKMEAENILTWEREAVALPGGLPSPASLDEARARQTEARRLNKAMYEHRSGYY